MTKTIINTKNAPAAVGPYVHAVKAGNFVFTSGQIGLLRESFILEEVIYEESVEFLLIIGAFVAEAGSSYSYVFYTSVFLDNINDFATVNEIYAKYFTGGAPARSCVEVASLPKGALVEIEVIAVTE